MSQTTKKETRKAKPTMASDKKNAAFSAEEREAMRTRLEELRAGADKTDSESAVLAKIGSMDEPDRSMATRLHAIVKANAPLLLPRLWYGMPAYARSGKVICFFQGASKFKTRYATLGFSDEAHLDEGALWPVAFALQELTADVEARIAALLKQALG